MTAILHPLETKPARTMSAPSNRGPNE
jgi:hypothetical protein